MSKSQKVCFLKDLRTFILKTQTWMTFQAKKAKSRVSTENLQHFLTLHCRVGTRNRFMKTLKLRTFSSMTQSKKTRMRKAIKSSKVTNIALLRVTRPA